MKKRESSRRKLSRRELSRRESSQIGQEFTHLDKIIFPQDNFTKEDVITYYQKIAPFLLPHINNHLIVMQRFPEGIDHEGFYQKQISDYFPAWIQRKTISLKKGNDQTLLLVNTQKDLAYLANQNVIVFHSWLSSIDHINKPSKIVFDLDPDNNSLQEIHTIAKAIKKLLEQHGLIPFIMTTGSRSYHVVIPIKPEHSFDIIHEFAKQIAQHIAQQYPLFCTADLTKEQRKNKIFIDYLRNSYGQTSVAAYSLRAHEKAPVATPIEWKELSTTAPQKYTLKNIFKRLARKQDPWKDFSKKAKPVILEQKTKDVP